MIASTGKKWHDKQPHVGTSEFLDKAKLCKGMSCCLVNKDGLFLAQYRWLKGLNVCDICAESEPVKSEPTPPPQKPEPLRFFSNTKAAEAKPVPYQRHKPGPKPEPKPTPAPKPPPAAKPDKAQVQAMVAAEVARMIPPMVKAAVRDELRRIFANV